MSHEARLRLFFVCAARRWTGGERALVAVANGLAARGHAVAFSYDPRGPVGDRLSPEVQGVAVVVRNDLDLRAVLRLRSLIRGHGADVVCVNTFREVKIGGLAARMAGDARVVNRRGSSDGLVPGLRARILYQRLIDMVVRDSAAGCEIIWRENPWFQRPVVQARNGIDPVTIGAVEPVPRYRLGAEEGEVLIAVLDRIGRSAGSPQAVSAAALAAERVGVPIRLVMIGDPGDDVASEVRQRVAATAGRVRVSLLGPRGPAETLRILGACDLLARSSRADGISYAVLEAMALGLPVIATAVGGLPEMVEDGVTGRLVPIGNADALAGAFTELAADPALRQRMGEAAKARVAREYSVERMLDEYEAAFRQVVGSTNRRDTVRVQV